MIKRFLSFTLLAAACIPAVIAEDNNLIIRRGGLQLLPPFAEDGKMFVYSYDHEVDAVTNIYRFWIYNDDFQQEKEFVTIPGTPNDYRYQIEERQSIPYKATVSEESKRSEALSIEGESEGLSIEMVLAYCNHMNPGMWEICYMEDNLPVVGTRFYYEEYFEKKYPSFLYRQVEGLWFFYEVSYQAEYGPYGDWKEPQIYEGLRYPHPSYVEIVTLDGSDGEPIILTRGFFSDDFNYMLPIYVKEEYNKEYTYPDTDWVYRKEYGYKSRIKGYGVYDSSNKEIISFYLPEGYSGEDDNLKKLWRLGNKRYLSLPARSDSGYANIIYRLDDNNKVTQVAIAPSTKVSPRAPRQGELVTVTFDENTIASPKTINVVSASGQNVYRTKLPAGQSSINLDTSRLNQGMYVVTVLTDGKSQEAAKIIVR